MKTLFKLFAVLFILNIANILFSIIGFLYCICNLFSNFYIFGQIFLFSLVMLFPLSLMLLWLLSEPTKSIKIWKLSLK